MTGISDDDKKLLKEKAEFFRSIDKKMSASKNAEELKSMTDAFSSIINDNSEPLEVKIDTINALEGGGGISKEGATNIRNGLIESDYAPSIKKFDTTMRNHSSNRATYKSMSEQNNLASISKNKVMSGLKKEVVYRSPIEKMMSVTPKPLRRVA
jgi:hypothetical protein